uniref:Mixed lineage kinase domain-containing protein n=1 Tax=Oryza punctata TaxID=4537 RepID=A0A0E0MHY6_ORYPU
MPGVTETIGLVAAIISIAGRIEQLTANAQHSREKCSQLKEHVISIRDLLKQLEKEEWTADLATEGVLRNLKSALDEAERLVRSCELKKPLFQRMINSQEKARKFDALDERISRILDRFQLVHIILIVNMQKDRFFMKVLDKLLQHGACRSLPKVVYLFDLSFKLEI